jgi:hypothetical protein
VTVKASGTGADPDQFDKNISGSLAVAHLNWLHNGLFELFFRQFAVSENLKVLPISLNFKFAYNIFARLPTI